MPKFSNPTDYTGDSGSQTRSGAVRFANATEASAGTATNVAISPSTLSSAVTTLIPDATEAVKGKARLATAAEAVAGVNDTTIMTPAKVALVAIAGAPLASEGSPGIAELATQAETNTGTDDARIVTPLKLKTVIGNASYPGSFTTLGASGAVTISSTGAVSITSDTASSLGVTGAGIDLTLSSAAGRVVVNGEEAAADALRLLSAAGGLDVDVALQMNLTSSQNAADAIRILSSAGGIDVDAVGAAGEDINITNTGGSVYIGATESAADSVKIESTAGGIDIFASGAAAGEDIDIVATGSSINIRATESVGDAVVVESTAGGVQILASGAAAGEDIVITATGSSVVVTATESAADSIKLESTAGGIDILASGAAAGEDIDIIATGSSINIQATESDVNAIVINASGVAGGINVDAGTSGFIVDTTGAISLDSAAASNFTVTGAFDLTASSSAGSVIVSAGEAVADALRLVAAAGGLDLNVALQMNLDSSQAAADAVRIIASGVAGGIDVDAGTAGIALDSTGAISLDGGANSNFSVTGAGVDMTIASAAGQAIMTGGEAAVNAIRIQASDAAGGMDLDAGTGGITVDTTGALSLDSQAASNFTVTGAFDLTLNSTAGSVNITAGESAADSMVLTSNGMDIVVSGAAGRDIDMTNTGGSINITATENVTDAILITASGAASAMTLDAGTGSIRFGSGLVVPVTSVNNAASPYTVLGTDYFISVDTSGGAVTVTLPAATGLAGRMYVIRDTGGAAAVNNITIGGGGTNLVGSGAAAASKTLSAAYSGAVVLSNGSTWNYAYSA